jgi:hypothetical protein
MNEKWYNQDQNANNPVQCNQTPMNTISNEIFMLGEDGKKKTADSLNKIRVTNGYAYCENTKCSKNTCRLFKCPIFVKTKDRSDDSAYGTGCKQYTYITSRKITNCATCSMSSNDDNHDETNDETNKRHHD